MCHKFILGVSLIFGILFRQASTDSCYKYDCWSFIFNILQSRNRCFFIFSFSLSLFCFSKWFNIGCIFSDKYLFHFFPLAWRIQLFRIKVILLLKYWNDGMTPRFANKFIWSIKYIKACFHIQLLKENFMEY